MTEGAHFSFSVRADERDAVVTVIDDGAALPNEVLQRALEQALARRFSQRMYSARIPLNPNNGHAAMPAPAYRARPHRRILVVDDNVDAAESLGLLLRQMGHDVQIAHDGHAALEAARHGRPQIVLLDLGMPGVNGYDMVERLRKDERLADVRFIAVTGTSGDEARQRSHEAGFEEHLVKPLDMEMLRKLLERL
jgi:two-component system CheB/CheR fusion protein